MVQHWRLAMRSGPRLLVDSGAVPDTTGFRWIESPKGRFYADPFLFEQDGKYWLFFEDYDYATEHGRISCAEVQPDRFGDPIPVLDRPYHLSYPCIFHAGSAVFMIPETSLNGTVELYRCVQFPDKWELEKELFKARAVDTTVCMDDGLYWFFVTLQEPRGHAIQFWLFYANEITDQWTPHPSNPISTDVRDSRGAGAIFRHDGKLLRPTQDCSKCYGNSFSFNEIELLNPCHYQEKRLATVEPVWAPGLSGTHTYAHAGQIEIIDGCALLPANQVLSSR
jgi:hypothetical protein